MKQNIQKTSQIKKENKQINLSDLDVSTQEIIEIKVPDKNQKIILTITKRTFYDPQKEKIVTDQVVHRAKYRIGSKKNKKEINKKKRG